MLHQYVKDFLAALSINVIKNFSMSQKNSINPKPFYPNSYLILTSTLQQEITSKIAKYSAQKAIFTDEKLQPTYIHI